MPTPPLPRLLNGWQWYVPALVNLTGLKMRVCPRPRMCPGLPLAHHWYWGKGNPVGVAPHLDRGIWILGFDEVCWVGCLPQFHGLALNPNRRLRFNKRLTRWMPNLDTDSSAANALASDLPAWTEVEVTYLYISKDKNNHYT